MGVATYNLASSISLISAQRLLRCLCQHCKIPTLVSGALLQNLGWQTSSHQITPDQPPAIQTPHDMRFYSAQGCSQCHKGYWGRIGIFQLMPITPTLQNLILQDAGRSVLAAQAEKEGVISLRHAGLLKAALGITSISEVLAHTTL
jgi:type IV pilus assembly protein PilB